VKTEVLICQHRTCAKDGASQVLQAFKSQTLDEVIVRSCGCLGLCGSGPIVLVTEPQQIYYWHIKVQDVSHIVKQHLKGGKVVKSLLHRRLHSEEFS
jgi:(2Fe-2S) ferredoxin